MAAATTDSISTIELDDDEYKVVQALFRNRYKAYDSSGNLVLQGKQKMLKMKEEFPFTDANGDPAFTVKAGGIFDVAGNYVLTDAGTEEPVIVLDNTFSFTSHTWKLRDPDTEALIATIESKSTLLMILRKIHAIFSIIPHKYEISDVDGDHVGSIEGEFSMKDTYTLTIDDASDVPKEAVVAAAMVIDAIEGN